MMLQIGASSEKPWIESDPSKNKRAVLSIYWFIILIETFARLGGERKIDEISLIEAENEANNKLLASFPTKSSGISAIFTRYLSRAKVSMCAFLDVVN